jgi:serine/threonine-protein kinase
VAIKVMADHRKNDAGALSRFLREARAVAALKHPNIVQICDVGQEGKIHFIVMEYIAKNQS